MEILNQRLKRFQLAVEIEPHDAEAHFACAQQLEAMGRSDEALAAYFRTLEFNPLHPEVSQRIGAIQLAPTSLTRHWRGSTRQWTWLRRTVRCVCFADAAHLILRHPAQAIADFRLAASSLPNRADVYYFLALALVAAHQPSDALKAAEQALRLAPDYADARDLSKRLRR